MKTIYVNKNIFNEEGELKRYTPKNYYSMVVIGDLDDNNNLVVNHYVKSGKYYYLVFDAPDATDVVKFKFNDDGDLRIVKEYFDLDENEVEDVIDGKEVEG